MRNFFNRNNKLKGAFTYVGAFFFFYLLQLICRFVFILFIPQAPFVFDIYLQSVLDGSGLDFSWSAYCVLWMMICDVWDYGLNNTRFIKGGHAIRSIKTHGVALFLILHMVVLAADILLYHFWGWRISAQAFAYLSNWKILVSTIPQSILVLGLVLVIFLGFFYWKLWKRICKSHSAGPELSFFSWIFLIVFAVIARGGTSNTPINIGSALLSDSKIIQVSSVNGMWNAVYSLGMASSTPDYSEYLLNESLESNSMRFYQYQSPNITENLTDQLKRYWLNDTQELPDIHLIICEGINQHWLEREQSPMNLLLTHRADFLTFTQCYAVGDRTDKGLASVIAGWSGEPGAGILFEPQRWKSFQGLPQIFKSAAYQSEFWYGGDLNFVNQKAFIKQMGYNRIYDQENMPIVSQSLNNKKIKWGFDDISVSNSMKQAGIKNKNQSKSNTRVPVFRTWLTLSTHEPFDVVPNNVGLSDKEKFARSIRFLDTALSSYIKYLKGSGNWQNQLIIIVSDHGKVFGLEDVPWSESEFFRIPLWVGGGALNSTLRNKSWNGLVNQSDIYATLSYMLTNKQGLSNSGWGRPMLNFNYFSSVIAFKGDFSVLITNNQERIGHLDAKCNAADTLDLHRRALQSKIIRKNFRF